MTRHFFMLVAGFACGIASICAVADTTPPVVNARPAYGPLSADQLTKIQGIGRAVLVAKHEQPQNPDAAAMEQELQGLSATLDKALMPVKPSKISVQLPGTVAPAIAQAAPSDNTASLQDHVSKLAARSSQIVNDAQQSGDERRMQRAQTFAAKGADIAQALQAALALPQPERFKALAVLRDRLKVKTLAEVERERSEGQPWTETTPSISTITHHRPLVIVDPKSLPPATGYHHGL